VNYQEAIGFLFQALPMYQRIGAAAYKKDLTNIRDLCKALGNPEQKFKSIHIGGTNGKGSCAHMLAAISKSAGYKTGLYTSPHLKRFTERIKVDGREIPETVVAEFITDNKLLIDKIQPSFFEMSVALAFYHFATIEVDIAIVEVGLGGRLDSTNILNPEAALITNISLDHTDMLGGTIGAIAEEKAGIIKEGVPIIIGEWEASSARVFDKISLQKRANIQYADRNYEFNTSNSVFKNKNDGSSYHMDQLRYWPYFQLKNIPGVLSIVDVLRSNGWDFTPVSVQEGIANITKKTGFKGRWQILKNKPLTICDIVHNIGGIKLIVDEFKRINPEVLHVIWGMVRDKDITSMLNLLPQDAKYYFCEPDIPRALGVNDLFKQAQQVGLHGQAIPNVMDAIKLAEKSAQDNDMIFIGGSTFVVAEIEGL